MPLFYLDSSALIKLYVQEPGTDAMLDLVDAQENRFALSVLAQIEFRCAVRRRQRAGDFSAEDVQILIGNFETHLSTLFVQQPANDLVIRAALHVADRHGLRALDALQLASCLTLPIRPGDPPATFVSSDEELLQAAKREDLVALNPTPGAKRRR